MPYIELKKINQDQDTKSFDVFGDNHNDYTIYDINKLVNYIEIVIDVRTRQNQGKDDTNIFFNFTNCE
jgi:hypothetical protein